MQTLLDAYDAYTCCSYNTHTVQTHAILITHALHTHAVVKTRTCHISFEFKVAFWDVPVLILWNHWTRGLKLQQCGLSDNFET